jgi:hypothetical protein
VSAARWYKGLCRGRNLVYSQLCFKHGRSAGVTLFLFLDHDKEERATGRRTSTLQPLVNRRRSGYDKAANYREHSQ